MQQCPWAHFLPGYGASKILIDGGLTGGFDEYGALLIALAWLGGLVVVATMLFRPPRAAVSQVPKLAELAGV